LKTDRPAPLIPKNWDVDTGYILFQSQDIFKQKSEITKELFNDLRALCIEYSPNGQPPTDRPRGEYGPDPLENIKIIREYVKKTYDSFIKDGCLPFIAIEDMFRNLRFNDVPFIGKNALRRMAEIPVNKKILKKYGEKEEKKKYEYQNIAKTISNLSKIERDLTYFAEFKPDKLIGFVKHKHESMTYKKAHYAVYGDNLIQNDLTDDEIYEDKETSEVAKKIIESFSLNLVHTRSNNPDIYRMELDPLSLIQFLKRLLLLHHTKPMEKRVIFYSKSRKRILKIE